jgi:hypothetical protein
MITTFKNVRLKGSSWLKTKKAINKRTEINNTLILLIFFVNILFNLLI